MNRQTARVIEQPAPQSQTRSATVIRFPFTLTVRPVNAEGRRRPSIALNLLLVVLLVLACVLWEAMSARQDATQDLPRSPVTSPRAAAALVASVAWT
jgi:hypothetical protein